MHSSIGSEFEADRELWTENESLTHEFFEKVFMAVVKKIGGQLLFVVPVPQVATKLQPQVHKQWITPVNQRSKNEWVKKCHC